jgi:2-polyprenyl-3-methyl-5-hydroxy-6-metoxy-1,4-benzoquinol methylase
MNMTDGAIEEHYREKKYEKISAGRRDGILALLGDFRNKQILDVGCANGALGKILKDIASCDVTGVEVSEHAAEEARKILDRVYVQNTEDEDVWTKELHGKKFDAIISSEVLEHLFAPEKLLTRFYQLADIDTKVVITVPNILFWKNRLRILSGHFEYEERGLMDRGHIHFFSWKSLGEMVTECGFEIAGTAHHVPTRGTKTLSRWFPGLFAQNFIIKLRKKLR